MAAKTRVSITVNEKEMEIFSIEEKKSGDLILLMKKSEEIQTGSDAQYTSLDENRFSIHNSPNSDGITITRTISSDNNAKKFSAHIKPHNGSIIWPIYACRCQILSIDRYIMNKKNNDTVINLGSFNEEKYSLVYFLVVGQGVEKIDRSLSIKANVRRLVFSSFIFEIWFTFMSFRSFHQNDELSFWTSQSERVNLDPNGVSRFDGTSMDKARLKSLFADCIDYFAKKLADRVVKISQIYVTPNEIVEIVKRLRKVTQSPY